MERKVLRVAKGTIIQQKGDTNTRDIHGKKKGCSEATQSTKREKNTSSRLLRKDGRWQMPARLKKHVPCSLML